MILGFTGTRRGLTGNQSESLARVLSAFACMAKEANHGDCVGSDTVFHKLVTEVWGIDTVRIWPPTDPKLRAWNSDRGVSSTLIIEKPMDYLKRDQEIVNRSDLLIACPNTVEEEKRSGTWTTWRYAKKKKSERIMISPAGIIDWRGMDGQSGPIFMSYAANDLRDYLKKRLAARLQVGVYAARERLNGTK